VGEFVVVTGIGHAATKWLAMVLDQPRQGIRFEHEPLMKLVKPDWTRARIAELESDSNYFAKYWSYVKAQLDQFRIYGDSMSWEPTGFLMVNEQVEINRVIFLVRNGISQLHSIWNVSLLDQSHPNDWLYDIYLKRYWELAERPAPHWENWSHWQRLCLWWNTNAFMPKIVNEWLPSAKVEIQKMEALTGDLHALQIFCRSFGLSLGKETLRKLQGQDVNRKIKGNRLGRYLWQQWSEQQRADFRQICGPGMKELGYSGY
jgi:hypothetical protein